MVKKISKAYLSFCNKITYFNNDIEFIDILSRGFHSDPSKYDFFYDKVDKTLHKSLANRGKTNKSRNQVIEHLTYSIYSSYIKDIYEEVMIYFTEVISMFIDKGIKNPGRFIGDSKITISLRELLESNDFSTLVIYTSKKILRDLEQKKDTSFILTQIPKKLGINIDEQKIKDTKPYLELRHLLVHNDGKIDQCLKNRFPDFPIKITSKGRIDLDLDLIIDYREKIKNLINEYGKVFISSDLIPNSGIHPSKKTYKK